MLAQFHKYLDGLIELLAHFPDVDFQNFRLRRHIALSISIFDQKIDFIPKIAHNNRFLALFMGRFSQNT